MLSATSGQRSIRSWLVFGRNNMPEGTMFNLDNAIEEWRRQMLAGGVQTPDVLEELENHLREDFEEQSRTHSQEQAFETPVRRLGEARTLQNEFKKLAGTTRGKHSFLGFRF